MVGRGVLLAALVALIAVGAGPAQAAPQVRLRASFDRGARLGAATALHAELRLARVRGRPVPLTSARLLFPASLGIVSGGLGLATCRRAAVDFEQVMISDGPGLGGCPPNALMGLGSAVADVHLSDGQVIPEYATLSILSGPIADGELGLVVFVDGQRPFGAKLAYAGTVSSARAPFGGALNLRLPAIPALEGVAIVSLVRLNLTIGSRAIRYYERRAGRRVAYRPEGVVLPARCPRGGFRFGVRLAFADGGRTSARTVVPCQPAPARGGDRPAAP